MVFHKNGRLDKITEVKKVKSSTPGMRATSHLTVCGEKVAC